MKDEFLTLLSHELRTPLTSVYGWVQLLQERSDDPQITAKALGVIDRNVRVQVQLIDDLLNISRIITGKLQIQRELVDPLAIVHTAIETIRPSADAKQIVVLVQTDPEIPDVSVDPNRLQQVVWNILSNAVKFTPTGGAITVTVRSSKTELRIAVADSGEGISSDFLPHVFDRFSQADTSKTRRHGGLGLGLALVRQLVELHGGTVIAESAGLGQGSTFTISLPA
jgi:signal transduction histidine kinase